MKNKRTLFLRNIALPLWNRAVSSERYLKNLTFMEHRQVPSLFLSLTAARETMDRTFLKVLYDTFMDFPLFSRKTILMITDTFPIPAVKTAHIS